LIRAWKYTSNLFVVRNDVGIALYEKFGFEGEGTHRRYAFRNGGLVDAYSMARVRG
jgi:putative acetyltransferase